MNTVVPGGMAWPGCNGVATMLLGVAGCPCAGLLVALGRDVLGLLRTVGEALFVEVAPLG